MARFIDDLEGLLDFLGIREARDSAGSGQRVEGVDDTAQRGSWCCDRGEEQRSNAMFGAVRYLLGFPSALFFWQAALIAQSMGGRALTCCHICSAGSMPFRSRLLKFLCQSLTRSSSARTGCSVFTPRLLQFLEANEVMSARSRTAGESCKAPVRR